MNEEDYPVVIIRPEEWQEYLQEIGPEVAQKVSRNYPDGCVGIFEGFRVYLR